MCFQDKSRCSCNNFSRGYDQILFKHWNHKESIIYTGRGGDKNNYLLEKHLNFGSHPYSSRSRSSVAPLKFELVHLNRYTEMKKFLDQNMGLRESDPAFFLYESAMIEYSAFNDAYSFYQYNPKKYPNRAIPAYISTIIDSIASNPGDYLYADETKEFLSNYVNYSIIKEGPGAYFDIDPERMLDRSVMIYNGATLSTYQADLVKRLIQNVNTDVAKMQLIEFFDYKVHDPR